jgi:long-subunit fatty acid transport protein
MLWRPDLLMKNTLMMLRLAVGLFVSVSSFAQTQAPEQKMSVNERMAKARAAKAEKKGNASDAQAGISPSQSSMKGQKATPADYKSPVDKTQKGPNGEVVHTGERGGKYYINKNGNKTYLSSNQ